MRTLQFQSTPPRGRRLAWPLGQDPVAVVSIHASTREATLRCPERPQRRFVSIHASTREATDTFSPLSESVRVSIHASTREATFSEVVYLIFNVSIHASTREATRSLFRSFLNTGFNPRLHAGGDYLHLKMRSWLLQFQSTPPRGRRLGAGTSATVFGVSIHASTREATKRRHACRGLPSFNPRLHAGGDHRPNPRFTHSNCFNPRLHAGGDAMMSFASSCTLWFQSTPPRGRRPIPFGFFTGIAEGFNPRLHAGGDAPANS